MDASWHDELGRQFSQWQLGRIFRRWRRRRRRLRRIWWWQFWRWRSRRELVENSRTLIP
jgi:hypothetical protein